MRKLRGQAHWLCQSPGGLPPLRQARPAPAQRNQASESILDEERGRAAVPLPLKGLTPLTGARCASQARGVPAIEGLRPYEDWLRQCFYPLPVPHKKTNLP